MNLFRVLVFSSALSLLGFADEKITWIGPTSHDFGEIHHGEVVSHSFTFKNTSGEPMKIDNVRTSCGCTTPDWANTPIPPDSLGQIIIEYDGRDKGYFQKSIKVYFSIQRRAEWLYIEGTALE